MVGHADAPPEWLPEPAHARVLGVRPTSNYLCWCCRRGLPRLAQSFTNFTTAKTKALTELAAANNTFANVLSTNLAKDQAEQKLAKALHKLIETVKALTNRFGKYVAEPGRRM
jgi:hypothetical protein